MGLEKKFIWEGAKKFLITFRQICENPQRSTKVSEIFILPFSGKKGCVVFNYKFNSTN
jgi:hypothetical protein